MEETVKKREDTDLEKDFVHPTGKVNLAETLMEKAR